jgi:uncharacterized Zn finger protein (UPF0148 family)
VRSKRLRFEEGAKGIREAMQASGIADTLMLATEKKECTDRLAEIGTAISSVRSKALVARGHSTESLADRGRKLALRLSQIEDSIHALSEMSVKDTELRNELLVFSSKFRRAQAARELLSGIQFTACPKCGKSLRPSDPDSCNLCGTLHGEDTSGNLDLESTDRDLKERIDELNSLIERHKNQVLAETENLRVVRAEKVRVDTDLEAARKNYDSAFVSQILELEKEKSTLQQKLVDLDRLAALAHKTEEFLSMAASCQAEETGLRAKLKVAREFAEQDATNLNRLKELFLDCLLTAGVDGIMQSDRVAIKSPTFMPSVFGEESGELIDTSFETLGSGGKKTLFKCCFAVAVHRLSVEKGVDIPSLLIIDSPMKNISERENRQQFTSFSKMLYDLSLNELAGTQVILIDKELNPPPKDYPKVFIERHMTPDESESPPLIRNYRGK